MTRLSSADPGPRSFTTFPGTPRTRECGGTTVPGGTTAPAPITLPLPMTDPSRTTAPIPRRQKSPPVPDHPRPSRHKHASVAFRGDPANPDEQGSSSPPPEKNRGVLLPAQLSQNTLFSPAARGSPHHPSFHLFDLLPDEIPFPCAPRKIPESACGGLHQRRDSDIKMDNRGESTRVACKVPRSGALNIAWRKG